MYFDLSSDTVKYMEIYAFRLPWSRKWIVEKPIFESNIFGERYNLTQQGSRRTFLSIDRIREEVMPHKADQKKAKRG